MPNLHVEAEGARDAVFITIRGIAQTEQERYGIPNYYLHINGAYVPKIPGISACFYDMERSE